jgi:glucosamine 6-phosphate synthetase-like amidotransferase/phosphosugar isomerase protein
MCGIFAYMGHKAIPITKVMQVLRILETEQEPGELTPVGGHGAGIAYLNPKNEFTLVKVGKTHRRSPVHDLKQQLLKLTTTQSQVILGHVRRASPEFIDTIQHAECTQPYKPHCTQHDLNIISAHNGYLENYQQLKTQLQPKHRFESEPTQLIDSEIISHLYEEQLAKTKNPTKAAHTLYEQAEGRNTIITLYTNTATDQAYLNVIQKGKTRGLVIWTTADNTVLLCSREKPTLTTFSNVLKENNYQKAIHITRNDSLNLEAHFSLDLNLQPTCQ